MSNHDQCLNDLVEILFNVHKIQVPVEQAMIYEIFCRMVYSVERFIQSKHFQTKIDDPYKRKKMVGLMYFSGT